MRWLVLLACLWLLPAAAHADNFSFVHTVREGETLASIAQRYYGDPKRESVLVAENGLTSQGGSQIVVGLRLIIPVVRYHRVQEGDTWRDLARKFYGNEKRVSVLLTANKAKPGSFPDEGAQLIVPYPVRHVAAQKDNLPGIAELYYGDRRQVRRLRSFNRMRGNRLQRGQIVLVPMADLVLSAEGRKLIERETGADLEAGNARAMQAKIASQLPLLREHVRGGRFSEAVSLGNRLLGSGELTGNQELSIQRELGTAYVALEREDLATQAFERALLRQPDLELDSAKTSPRVLRAFARAKESASERLEAANK